MPVLTDVKDHEIVDYYRQVRIGVVEAELARLKGRSIQSAMVRIMGKASVDVFCEPANQAHTIARVRTFDAMVPDGSMSAQDALLMCTRIGRKAFKAVLTSMPSLAHASGFDRLRPIDDDDVKNFPYNMIAALGFANMDEHAMPDVVCEFRAAYRTVQLEETAELADGAVPSATPGAGTSFLDTGWLGSALAAIVAVAGRQSVERSRADSQRLGRVAMAQIGSCVQDESLAYNGVPVFG